MKAKTMKYRVLCHILVFLLCVSGLLAQTAVQDSLKTVTSTNATVHQSRNAINTLYLELGGNTLSILSINYEQEFAKNFSFRVGLGLGSPVTLAGLVNGFVGDYDHRFEYGVGFALAASYSFQIFPTARLGYRYQPINGGFNFGIAFTPVFFYEVPVFPFGGISLGWGF